jgi:hypothetical protein
LRGLDSGGKEFQSCLFENVLIFSFMVLSIPDKATSFPGATTEAGPVDGLIDIDGAADVDGLLLGESEAVGCKVGCEEGIDEAFSVGVPVGTGVVVGAGVGDVDGA